MSDRRRHHDSKRQKVATEDGNTKSIRNYNRTTKPGLTKTLGNGRNSKSGDGFRAKKDNTSSRSKKGDTSYNLRHSSAPTPNSLGPKNPCPENPPCDVGCKKFQLPQNIPKPRPRPQPSQKRDGYQDAEYERDIEKWDAEYKFWKYLTCACKMGYYCKAHGKFVSGSAVRAGQAPCQENEDSSTCHPSLPPFYSTECRVDDSD